MDRRDLAPHETAYQQDLKKAEAEVDDKVVENGKTFRIPYKMVSQIVFTNVSREELLDLEHSARLQYRLLLQDSVLKAKVEFAKSRITIVYNPEGANNRKEKISPDGIINFLASEGVNVEKEHMELSDYDYYKEMYSYQFDPPSIREHPPYSYTPEQWKAMKEEYYKNTDITNKEKLEKFHEWQDRYLAQHPELEQMGARQMAGPKKLTLRERLLGKKAAPKKEEKEKGFWFHGV